MVLLAGIYYPEGYTRLARLLLIGKTLGQVPLGSLLLQQASPPFFFQSSLIDRSGDLCLLAHTPTLQGIGQQLAQSLYGHPAICLLRSIFLRNHSQQPVLIYSSCEPGEYSPLLSLGKALTVDHIKEHSHTGVDLVDILAAGPAASRGPEDQFTLLDICAICDLNHCICVRLTRRNPSSQSSKHTLYGILLSLGRAGNFL